MVLAGYIDKAELGW